MTTDELLDYADLQVEKWGDMGHMPLVAKLAAALRAEREHAKACDARLSRVLHELAGAASLCWEPRPTGVFDSSLALSYVEGALTELRNTLRGEAQ
jgi:hypothetical protein